jgi:hypothetical protein
MSWRPALAAAAATQTAPTPHPHLQQQQPLQHQERAVTGGMGRYQVLATSNPSKRHYSCWRSRMWRQQGGCCSTTQALRPVLGLGLQVQLPLVAGH